MGKPLSCGACNLCCKLLEVADIGKPARMLCWWTNVHGGCAVHNQKPTDPKLAACHQWACLWLVSQDKEPEKRMPRNLRPDISHVVFGPQDKDDNMLLYVQVDPDYPTAWKQGEASRRIEELLNIGVTLEVIVGDNRFTLEPTEGVI